MRRERSLFSVVLGIFLSLFAVFVVGGLCLVPALRGTKTGTPEGIPVPYLVGRRFEACDVPQALTAHLHYQTDASHPEGTVLAQSPMAGVLAREGTELDLTISTLHAPVRLPDVIGCTGRDAVATLAALGLTADVVHEVREDLPDGTVIACHPGAGEQVFPQQAVTLVCAQNSTVSVPDVVGLSLDDAILKLEGAGLSVGSVTHVPHAVASGTVLSQSVPGRAEIGAVVALMVAESEK